mmetsp:Transcript_19578/g.29729  ORF Transcript_19578/g.29729 Transcript_19578/m.29729 type:complete len:270 (+) Transcript_19578:159-968(+)
MSSRLNESQNGTLGMICGVIEVVCLQPLNYWKNMTQQGQPLSINPFKLYRGVAPNCLNMGSCTTIQFAVGGKMKQLVLGSDTKRTLTPQEEIFTALVGGTTSAVVGSPLELIMIQQQRKGLNMAKTVQSILPPQIFVRGLVGCAVREALWTVGYLSIPPIVRRNLMTHFPEKFDSEEKARAAAALLGGFFGCYATHPFDTVKTCMQGDIERVKFGTFSQTARIIYGESGIPGFYRGAPFRYGRMVIAVFMLDKLQAVVGPLLYPDAFKD